MSTLPSSLASSLSLQSTWNALPLPAKMPLRVLMGSAMSTFPSRLESPRTKARGGATAASSNQSSTPPRTTSHFSSKLFVKRSHSLALRPRALQDALSSADRSLQISSDGVRARRAAPPPSPASSSQCALQRAVKAATTAAHSSALPPRAAQAAAIFSAAAAQRSPQGGGEGGSLSQTPMQRARNALAFSS